MFTNKLNEILNEEFNYSTTENGALGYRTSGKNLVDLNFRVSSLRSADEKEITDLFSKAFFDNKELALKWLFFARDVREGMGERRLFRVIALHLANNLPEYIQDFLSLVPEYGRWDDLFCLLDTNLSESVLNIILNQFEQDIVDSSNANTISLLAKWLPSFCSKKKDSRKYASIISKFLGLTKKEYTQSLTKLRKYLDVVEVKMSAKEWDKIKYDAVPSKANLIYKEAFLRNDSERRLAYLKSLKKGEAKINASTLYPHEILHKYGMFNVNHNETLEQLWKNLPDTVKGDTSTIVVADGSGSMFTKCDNSSNLLAIDVCNAFAIYFSERCSGEFKDKYITFSERPQLVDLSKCNSLQEKAMLAERYDEVANTNIEKVFDLILTTAIKNKIPQNEIPNILIISDMEFDSATEYSVNERLFTTISQKYKDVGYALPKLSFWNICGRTHTVPVKENENGVALISGFSPQVASMVLSNKIDPYEILIEKLSGERYAPIKLN